jgi:hypothetical protein
VVKTPPAFFLATHALSQGMIWHQGNGTLFFKIVLLIALLPGIASNCHLLRFGDSANVPSGELANKCAYLVPFGRGMIRD